MAIIRSQKKTELIVLSIQREILGKDHPDIANSLANLASLHEELQEYPEAVKYYQEALGIIRNIYGEQNSTFATILKGLAILYGNIGNREKARELLNKIHFITKGALPEDHPDIPPVSAV